MNVAVHVLSEAIQSGHTFRYGEASASANFKSPMLETSDVNGGARLELAAGRRFCVVKKPGGRCPGKYSRVSHPQLLCHVSVSCRLFMVGCHSVNTNDPGFPAARNSMN